MFERLISDIASALEGAGMPYMVIGGQAVLLYGEPRLTRDIDITLGVGIDKLGSVISIMKGLKLHVIPENPSEFVEKTWVLPLVEKRIGIRVDLIFSWTPYEKQAIGRARKIEMKDARVNFASPEDVIIHKIFAGRPRDIEDIKAILLKNPRLDLKYIRGWLRKFEESMEGMDFSKRFDDSLNDVEV